MFSFIYVAHAAGVNILLPLLAITILSLLRYYYYHASFRALQVFY